MTDPKTDAPIPPEGSDAARAARQEAADAAYARKREAEATGAAAAEATAATAPTEPVKPANEASAEATAKTESVEDRVSAARVAETKARDARRQAEAQAKTAKAAAKKEERAKKQKEAKPVTLGKAVGAGVVSAVCVVVIAALLFVYTPLGSVFRTSNSSTGVSGSNITIDANSEDTALAQAVAAKCVGSTVTIYVYSDEETSWSQLFGGSSSSSSSSPSALGSGVIIQSDENESYILTNYHVVEGISKAQVKVNDESYDATAVGYDENTDLAVIKIDCGNLTAMEWGDSDNLNVGEWVMAIGSPYGYEQTVTTGIVSAKYRSDTVASENSYSATTYTDMIQTDAAINPGNSGGALVNSSGQLVGINTYISSTSQSSAGLGFAIPVNEAKKVAETLMEGGTVEHAFLGIKAADSSTATIGGVYEGTAADEAGLEVGDVITKIDDTAISSFTDVYAAISSHSPGDTITITYTRDGKEATAKAKLGSDADDSYKNATLKDDGSSNSGNGSSNGGQGQGNGNGGSNGYGYGDSGSDGFSLGDLFNYYYGGGSSNGGSGSGSSGSSNSGSDSSSGSFWN